MSKCFSETFCSPSPHQAGGAIHGTYFPHIDGLRTFAVLAVVLYHLQEGICPGGYAGVARVRRSSQSRTTQPKASTAAIRQK